MKRTRKKAAKPLVYGFLLPSVKMKSHSSRGVVFEQELHKFLMEQFGGYTVTGGSITGYWKRADGTEECNEHRAYQVAVKNSRDIPKLRKFIVHLGKELGEESVFSISGGEAQVLSTDD